MRFEEISNFFFKSNFQKKKNRGHILLNFFKIMVIFRNSKILHYTSFNELGWKVTFAGEQAHHTKFPFKKLLRFLSFPFPKLQFFWGFF
jgi:hypothetical protein